MIAHFLNPPNWFTAASLFCSTYALTLLIGAPHDGENIVRACILVVFGGIFDMLDGRVARLTRRGSDFGTQLDSIADIVGFGIAPAMIAWTWKLHALGPVGVAIAFWYVLCAAFRLARFNVGTLSGSPWTLAGHSQGLTSTMSGGILVCFVWASEGYFADRLVLAGPVFAGFVALLGYLMISSIPFRNFRDLRRNRNAVRLLAVALATCLAGAVVFDPSVFWLAGAALYLFGGLADGIFVAWYHRRLGRALLVTDEVDEDEDEAAWEAE